MTVEVMTSQFTDARPWLPHTSTCDARGVRGVRHREPPVHGLSPSTSGGTQQGADREAFADYLCGLMPVDLPVCLLCHSVSRRMASSSRSVGHEL